MPLPEQVIPVLEGLVGTMANENAYQQVSQWVENMKAIMRMPQHRALSDWAVLCIPDIDEDAAAGPSVTAPESGARLYGILFGQQSSDASEDYVAVCNDADGAIAAFAAGDTRVTDTPRIMVQLEPATTDGTEEYTDIASARGFPFAAYMSFAGDGEDGTNIDTDDVRCWIVYRTAV